MKASNTAGDTAGDSRMVTALVQLHQSLVAADLPFDLPGTVELRVTRTEIIDQLEDYVIPRVMTLDAPLLAVVGGSTGAGKSTLVNSLVGHRVTTPGVLRPTTRSPVLVHHPDDAHWFGQDRLLPDLVRVQHTTDDPDSIQLVATDAVPVGLAILDAPDVDSVEERNRFLAAQLLAAGDLWLFVTSAARYADQVPWGFLKQAAERSTSVAIVLDRTPDDAIQTVATHLARMLASRGLRDSPLFTVTEGKVDEDGLLPPHHVADIRAWLESLADDTDARDAIVKQTLDGAVRAITRRTYPIADASIEQSSIGAGLKHDVDAVYDRAVVAVIEASADSTLLRGEVLARWQEFVGTGELLRSLDSRVGGLRDRLVNTIKGKPQQAERVSVAVEAGLEALILKHAESAAEASYAVWQQSPAGAGLLAAAPGDLGRAALDLRRRAERMVRDWQLDVLEMVRTEGADKRTTARFLAFGVNGLSVALMIVVFSRTTEVTGAEAGVAGGSVVLGQKLLAAVFGDQDLRTLTERARRSLEQRMTALLHDERTRYLSLVDAITLTPDAADRLRAAVRRVDDLRYQASKKDVDPGATP